MSTGASSPGAAAGGGLALAANIGTPDQYVTVYSGMDTAPFLQPPVPREVVRQTHDRPRVDELPHQRPTVDEIVDSEDGERRLAGFIYASMQERGLKRNAAQ